MTDRYAIYFAPQDNSELEIFGATVLRRRAVNANEWINPQLPVAFPESAHWQDLIKRPAHYGFHATIKAPFELAKGESADELVADLAEFCRHREPIKLNGLAPIRTSRYDALAFDDQPGALPTLAADCVTHFEKYRAPLTQADIDRRDPASLNDVQRDYLARFGYPYIMDDFNFHMTLSGSEDRDDVGYLDWLQTLYRSMVNDHPVLDRLCVFHQPDRSTAFVRTHEFIFGAKPAL